MPTKRAIRSFTPYGSFFYSFMSAALRKLHSVGSYQLSVNAKEYKNQIHLKALFFSAFAVSLPLSFLISDI